MREGIAASIHQRLLNRARAGGQRFNELLQHFALERWLYRLSVSGYVDRCVLKGALMLTTWRLPTTRPTRDIDLLARVDNDLENVRRMIIDICSIPARDDGLVFPADGVAVERIATDALYEGVRSTFKGFLGKARIAMQIDLGFSDIVTPGPVDLVYPTILDHPAPRLKAYNRETVIAEKLEAMVRLGELNSRMKDFFDLWSLAASQPFVGTALSLAIARTFARRGTPLSPDAACFVEAFGGSANKQQQWQAFLRRNLLVDRAPGSFVEAWRLIRAFLLPVTASRLDGSRWTPGGPWEPSPGDD